MLSAHENPYRTSRLENLRFRFPPGWNMERLLRRLDALGGRGAITGPRGCGKTTLLGELGHALERRGQAPHRLRLGHEGNPPPGVAAARLARLGPGDAVLLDLGEQMGALGRWRVLRSCRRAGVVVAAAHRPWGLPVLVELAMTPRLGGELLAELDPRWRHAPPGAVEALLERHGYDLHRVLLALYDGAGSNGVRSMVPPW